MRKLLSCILVIVFLFAVRPVAQAISPKTGGKFALVAILSGVAIFTRYLVKHEIHTSKKLHLRLGTPNRVVEFERGVNRYRIEWYSDHAYIFRNDVLHKISKHESDNLK